MASINGTKNNDVITGTKGNDTINAKAGGDTVFAGLGNDQVQGGAGNDILYGEGGNDKLLGGAGDDTLDGGSGKDELDGGAGKDTLIGGAGDDDLGGGSGDDMLLGGTGSDQLNGGSGDDTLDGGQGSDCLDAGSGSDIAIYVRSENKGDCDFYDGGSGTDTLRLVFTAAELASSAVQADIAAFQAFLSQQHNKNKSFHFSSANLTVKNFEQVQIVNLTPANAAPAGADNTVTLNEDGSYVFAVSDFGFSDGDGDNFASVKISSLPAQGTLKLNGVAVTAGSLVSIADIAAGQLVFKPAKDANGTNYASFTFQVKDDGGTAGGGIDLDQSPNTMKMNVDAVNDAPVLSVQGVPDLAFSTVSSGDASVVIGDGTGAFGSPIAVPTGNGQIDVALADLDGDGDNELITTNTDSTVRVQLNNGDGTFAAGAIAGMPGAGRIATGDVNGDGKLDVVTSNFFDVGVLLGGAGGFSSAITVPMVPGGGIPAGVSVVGVNLGDVDNDGDLDIITANYEGGVSVLVGDGTGNFEAETPMAAGSRVIQAVVADLNGDNNLDIITANQVSRDVVILYGDGAGGFTAAAPIVPGSDPFSVAIGDVDHDGDMDIAVGQLVNLDPAQNYVRILLGDGFGGFALGDAIQIDDGPAGVRFSDFNSDGNLDIVTGNGFNPTSTILIGNGAGNFAIGQTITIPGGFFGFAVGEVDGGQVVDEDDTLVFSGANQNKITLSDVDAGAGDETVTLSVLHGIITLATTAGLSVSGDGTDSVSLAGTVAAINAALDGLTYAPAADYNGDDTLTITANDNGNTGTGGALTTTQVVPIVVNPFDEPIVNLAPSGADKGVAILEDTNYTFAVADFGFSDPDGNNFDNVLVTRIPTRGFLTNNGAFVSAGQLISVGDIADGKFVYNTLPDSALTDYGEFDFQVVDDGGTVGGGADTDDTPNKISIEVLHVNDAPSLSMQGEVYVVVHAVRSLFNPAHSVTVIGGDGAGNFGPYSTFGIGDPGGFEFADVNGDHEIDIVSSNVQVLFGDGTGAFIPGPVAGGGGIAMDVGDIDGDGDIDVVTCEFSGDTAVVLLNDGAGNFTVGTPIAVGDGPQDVAIGDFNGDGRKDILVANYQGNSVSILLADGFGGFVSSGTVPVGTNPYSIAVGDIDHDNDLDFVTSIFINGSGTTVETYLNDGAGAFAFNSAETVTRAPIPVELADMDNDGNLDIITSGNLFNDVSVLFGDGAGGFGDAVTTAVPRTPIDIALADFDSDGDLDIITASFNQNGAGVVFNDGDRTFTPGPQLGSGIGPQAISAYARTAISVDEDTSVTFDSTNRSLITLSDIDHFGGNETVSLTVGHGSLTLSTTSGLTVTGDGSAAVSLTGTVADINAALNGLTYAPDADYFGDDNLTITASDDGNFGIGGALSDSLVVSLLVHPVDELVV